MATRVNSTGIVFNDNTVLSSKYGIIPQNSLTFFHQATAPVGWAKSTSHDNKTLRVVSGTGGGSAGTQPFTTVFNTKPYSGTGPVSVTVGPHILSTPQLPSHTHPAPGLLTLNSVPASFNPDGSFSGWNGGDVGRSAGWNRTAGGTSGGRGGGAGHSHSSSSGSCSFSGSIDLRIRYIDVILCKFS
jgi:hypothetical protein